MESRFASTKRDASTFRLSYHEIQIRTLPLFQELMTLILHGEWYPVRVPMYIAGRYVINHSTSSSTANQVYSSPPARGGSAARRQSSDETRGDLANHRADSERHVRVSSRFR